MTPLERAARALSENLEQQADKLGFVATDATRYPVLDGCFDMQEAIRAVIQAIREPSEAMEQAGYGSSKGDPDNTGIVDNPRPDDAWRDMIDALLAEGA